FGYKLLHHYRIGVDLGGVLKPGFRDELARLKCDPATTRDVDAAADLLALRRQAARLAKFYQRVAASRKGVRLPRIVRRAMLVPGLSRPLWALNDALHAQNAQMQELHSEKDQLSNRLVAVRGELKLGRQQIDEVAGQLNWPELSNEVERRNGFTELVYLLDL